MKKTIFLFLAFMTHIVAHAQYHCSVTDSDREKVSFRVVGYGKNAKTAIADAELSAIKTICFLGADGTIFSQPLVTERQAIAESRHQPFFHCFYNGDYKNFIETSVVVTPFGKDSAKRKCLTMIVCVKASSLRLYLEQNAVTRKFGL